MPSTSLDLAALIILLLHLTLRTMYVHTFVKAFENMRLFTEGIHLIGHHSVGSLSLEMAILYPTAVRSIALIGLNKPVADGSHLVKTWEYLGDVGCSDDLLVKQQELLNHVRAWNDRMRVFGTVWDQNGMALFKQAQCLILALCSKTNVL
jgi:hypothetical protein